MFKWNGSNITDFINNKKIIIREAIYEKNIFWTIWDKTRNISDIGLVRSSSNNMPCLIDEMKPAFGLEKIGTHWFKFGGKIMILSKVIFEDGSIVQELHLNQIKYNKKLETEVQKIFVFRELLGLSKNFESSIILRKKGYFIQPVSFYEPNMNPGSCKTVLPNTVLQKWFPKTDIDHSVLKIIPVDTAENINSVLSELKGKLDKIANRVNPDAITHMDEIISRLRSRLQFIMI